MHQLEPVEEARALLASALDWSILHWLAEKKRVRTIADRGTAALDDEERRIKSQWSEELSTAYAVLCAPSPDDPYAEAEYEFVRQQANGLSESVKAIARRVKDADEVATKARDDAERMFDDAEKKMSAALARRGAELAITAYDVRYEALEVAESARDT